MVIPPIAVVAEGVDAAGKPRTRRLPALPVGQYAILVAARLDGSAPDRPIGVWALGSWLGGARVMAIDGPARRWSDWGRAVADRSAAGQQRSRIAARPEVLAVRACMG